MKPTIYYLILFFCISFYNCKGQSRYSNNSLGIGFLETNTVYPIFLFKNENDSKPIDTIKFKTRENGSTEFITKINLKPYHIFEGQAYDDGKKEIDEGLAPINSELKFRVIDTTDTYFKVITNEKSKETYFIKIDSKRAYYKTLSQVYEHNCPDCSNSKYNPNWNVFETWERYLMRVEYIEKRDLKIYDQPNGKVIFKNSNNDFLPFEITKVKREWIKLKKGFGREFNFDESKNYNGWTQWRIGNKILIDITEQTYI